MRTRNAPVENLELGHFVSSVAHLGNIALRSNSKVLWDSARERATNDRKAERLVGVPYRKPWSLPYMRRPA